MNIRAQSLCFILLVLLLLLVGQADAQSRKNKAQPAPSPTSHARFISGTSSLEIPFELSNNLVLVEVKVNDSAATWFIFDTGAEISVIDNELAKTLRLKAAGKILGTGGAGTEQATRFQSVSVSLPNVEISNLTLYGLQVALFSPAFGRKIGGVIGYDIIKEFVVEVDYASRKINLYRPESYVYRGTGEIFPLTFEENMPFIRASMAFDDRQPLEGKFEIDTRCNRSTTTKHAFR